MLDNLSIYNLHIYYFHNVSLSESTERGCLLVLVKRYLPNELHKVNASLSIVPHGIS